MRIYNEANRRNYSESPKYLEYSGLLHFHSELVEG